MDKLEKEREREREKGQEIASIMPIHVQRISNVTISRCVCVTSGANAKRPIIYKYHLMQ